MRKVTVKGQTVEEAVQEATRQLGVTQDQLQIRLIQEPSKGFLGFLSKPAIIEAEIKEEELPAEVHHGDPNPFFPNVEKGVQFLEAVLPKMGLSEVKVHVKQEKDQVLINLEGKELGLAIGKRGQTLDALQYLTNVVANRGQKERVRFIVDAENYRERRRKSLEQLADRLAKEVIRTREKITLEPMSAADRKIIHTHLQHYAGVKTISEGEEPNRRVVLWPK